MTVNASFSETHLAGGTGLNVWAGTGWEKATVGPMIVGDRFGSVLNVREHSGTTHRIS